MLQVLGFLNVIKSYVLYSTLPILHCGNSVL